MNTCQKGKGVVFSLTRKGFYKKRCNSIIYIIRVNKGKDKILEFFSVCGPFNLGVYIGST